MQIKDIFSRLYKLSIDVAFYSLLVAVILGILPNHLFKDFNISPTAFDIEHIFKSTELKNWNDDLVTKANLIGSNQLIGPESIADVGEYLYTGLADGRLVRVQKSTEKIENVARFGSKVCDDGAMHDIDQCGRILGLRYHTDQHLYALEAKDGLYRINVTDHSKQLLTKDFASKKPVIYNDLVFDPKHPNLVYISVSSSKWELQRIAYSILDHEYSGYVIGFDMKTGKYSKITEGHSLTNGVEVTADQSYLLVSETNSYVIKKVELSKAREAFKTGKALNATELENFSEMLHGEPDNIRLDPSTGDILVGVFTSRPHGRLFRDYLSNWPFVRKSIARVAHSLSVVLNYVDANLYSNHALKQLSQDLYSGHIIYKVMPQRDGAVFKLDGKAGIVKQVLGSSKFNSISEAIVDQNGDLYFGSFRNPFLGRIPKGSH